MQLSLDQILKLGIQAHKEGELEKAKGLYEDVLRINSKHAEANHNIGVLYIGDEKFEEAMRSLKTALESDPSVHLFWISYISILLQTNLILEARIWVVQARSKGVSGEKIDSLEKEIDLRIGAESLSKREADELLGHYSKGRLKLAEKIANSFSQRFPNHPFPLKLLGTIFAQTSRNSEALLSLKKATEVAPQDSESHNNLGLALVLDGKLEEAVASFQTALNIEPSFFEACLELGKALKRLNRTEEAESYFSKAISMKSDSAEAHNCLGELALDLGKLDFAEQNFRKAIQSKVGFAQAHSNLGAALHSRGEIQAAELSYKTAIELDTKLAQAHFNLGQIARKSGRYEDAVTYFRRALEIEPKNPNYYFYKNVSVSSLRGHALGNAEGVIESIERGEWEISKRLLEDLCARDFRHTVAYIDEFTERWCHRAQRFLDSKNPHQSIPVFVELLIFADRDPRFLKFLESFWKKINTVPIGERLTTRTEILLQLGRCHYLSLRKEYQQAEVQALETIEQATSLLSDLQTEDLGWLVIRRSLGLFEDRELARGTLISLVENLGKKK